MARQPRIEYAGAAYHVLARGNQGRGIYGDDADRKLWLETLSGGLWATTTDPGLSGGSKAVPHKLSIKWDCTCNSTNKTTVIVEQVPKQ